SGASHSSATRSPAANGGSSGSAGRGLGRGHGTISPATTSKPSPASPVHSARVFIGSRMA
ncbi:MAG: hypothetical protein WBK37_06835, partial [Kiritimatiellia bacterium]